MRTFLILACAAAFLFSAWSNMPTTANQAGTTMSPLSMMTTTVSLPHRTVRRLLIAARKFNTANGRACARPFHSRCCRLQPRGRPPNKSQPLQFFVSLSSRRAATSGHDGHCRCRPNAAA